jgi:predicted anti-sigma-YlaC factor YlaD
MTAESAIKWRSRQPHFRIRWNYIESITDYLFVDCEDFREALSARLDNEEDANDARQPIDTHLARCEDCAFWYDTAALITRRARTTATVVWPDVSDAVLARVPTSGNRARPDGRPALGAADAPRCAEQKHESEARRREYE